MHDSDKTLSLHDTKTTEKNVSSTESTAQVQGSSDNLIYDNANEEPELHARTYIAVIAFIFLNFVQVFALQGPPAILPSIAQSLHATSTQTWVINAYSLIQAVIGPVIASASDIFQARKIILVTVCCISVIGCGIAPGSQSVGRLIAAQVLIGFGFAAVPLAYAVPSEIVPKKWYSIVQGAMNTASSVGSVSAPLIAGALASGESGNGWRNFYWIQLALWAVTALGILFGYRPPKRHTRLDHLSLLQKISNLDLIGFLLLSAGLTLFLVGVTSGGSIYSWSSGQVLGTLISGIVTLIAFGLYEWKGTATGILHHDLFRQDEGQARIFGICIGLIFLEGVLLFAYVVFYPQLTAALFETDPFLITARTEPFWIAATLVSGVYGYLCSRFRTVRPLMFTGFLLLTASVIGMATIQPGQSINALVFNGLAGIGFGSPLVLIVTSTQLTVPHHSIATASAVLTSSRAIAVTVFTAIYTTVVSDRAGRYIPQYVSQAAIATGLPPAQVGEFIAGLSTYNGTALAGISPSIVGAGAAALQQANADSIRAVYIIAAAFGAVGCVACWFLWGLSGKMDYRVNAPIERLKAKRAA